MIGLMCFAKFETYAPENNLLNIYFKHYLKFNRAENFKAELLFYF